MARPRPPSSVVADAVTDFLSGKPINSEATIKAAEELLNQWVGMGGGYRPDVGVAAGGRFDWQQIPLRDLNDFAQRFRGASRQAHGDAHQNRRPGVAPQVDPAMQAALAARQVMGFAASERLTQEMVKDRRRLLAKRYHPDVTGGSAARMAQVNDAADVLLKSL